MRACWTSSEALSQLLPILEMQVGLGQFRRDHYRWGCRRAMSHRVSGRSCVCHGDDGSYRGLFHVGLRGVSFCETVPSGSKPTKACGFRWLRGHARAEPVLDYALRRRFARPSKPRPPASRGKPAGTGTGAIWIVASNSPAD